MYLKRSRTLAIYSDELRRANHTGKCYTTTISIAGSIAKRNEWLYTGTLFEIQGKKRGMGREVARQPVMGVQNMKEVKEKARYPVKHGNPCCIRRAVPNCSDK